MVQKGCCNDIQFLETCHLFVASVLSVTLQMQQNLEAVVGPACHNLETA